MKSKYTWDPTDYEDNSKAQFEWAKELITKLSLKGDEHLLDIGCGDGKISALLSNMLPQGSVIGIDNSTTMVQLAKDRHADSKYPNLMFQVMDARSLSFHDQFDIIFSNAALHWIRNHKPIVRGVFNALRCGGRTLLQMGGEGNAKHVVEVVENLTQQKEWCEYFKNFEFPYGFLSDKEYRNLLVEQGFEVKRVELISKTMTHQNIEKLKGWIRTTWLPYLERIPEVKRADFIAQVAASYNDAVTSEKDGCIAIDMVRLEVEANKP